MSAERFEANTKKLIMLRGNSGSGKTTLAHMLQHELGRGTLVISQDVVRREMLWVHDKPGHPAIPLLISVSHMAGAQNRRNALKIQRL